MTIKYVLKRSDMYVGKDLKLYSEIYDAAKFTYNEAQHRAKAGDQIVQLRVPSVAELITKQRMALKATTDSREFVIRSNFVNDLKLLL